MTAHEEPVHDETGQDGTGRWHDRTGQDGQPADDRRGPGALAAPVRRGAQVGDADFTTLSGAGDGAGIRAAAGRGGAGLRAHRLAGGVSRSPAASTRPATGAGPGRSASSPGSATHAHTNERYKMLLGARRRRAVGRVRHAHADGPGLRRPAVARRGRALRGGHRLRGGHGHPVRRHPAGRRHHLDDDQRPGGAGVLHVPGRRRAPGRRPRRAGRHAADRHLQGVHRAEGMAVPAAAAPAADRRPDGVLRGAHPGLQAAVGVRLPHQGGRLHRRAGTRVHPGRRVRLRGARPVPRPRHRRVRARPVVLLRRAHRLLRGDRQVPRRPPDLGPVDARRLRRDAPSGPSGCASTPRPPGCR